MMRVVWLLLVFALLVGCGRSEAHDLRPPHITLVEEPCAECGMTITDLRFASAAVFPNGDYLLFDDIGDLAHHHAEHEFPAGTSFFVYDYEASDEWMAAEAATFVRSREIHSPMGSGLVAFREYARAEALATAMDGTLLSFQELMGHR